MSCRYQETPMLRLNKKENMPAGSALQITKVSTREGFKDLRADWQRLAALEEQPNVFSTWEWNSCWWQVYGREGSLYVLVIEREDEIVGIAPFHLVRRPRNSPVALRVLSFIGSNDDSGLLDILTLPGTREMVWRTIFLFLASNEDWDVLELNNLDAGMATRQMVADEVRRQRWMELSYESPTVQMRLPGTWKEFLAGTSSRMRRHLALFERKLKEQHYELTYTQPQSVSELSECLERLFEIHTRRWAMTGAEGAFCAKRRALYHLVATATTDTGWLDLWELRLSGRTVAIEFGLHYRGCRYALQSGFEMEFAHYSVGRLLQAFLIRTSIERGDHSYDFLFGEQEFKVRWGTEPRCAFNIRIVRQWSFGSLAMRTARLLGKGLRYQTGRDSE
jgi:CelD/BcsL family acetyltransferase involved in cellulose biosynthesis